MVANIPPKIRDKIISTIPLRRLAEPEEIARAALFILQNDFYDGRELTEGCASYRCHDFWRRHFQSHRRRWHDERRRHTGKSRLIKGQRHAQGHDS